MIECKKVEEQIVSGCKLTDDAQAHLLQCVECQKFSGANILLQGNGSEQGPSSELDKVTLKSIRSQFARSKVGSQSMRVQWYRRVVIPAAAALLLFLGIWSLRFNDNLEGGYVKSEITSESLSAWEQWLVDWSLEKEEMDDLEIGVSALAFAKFDDYAEENKQKKDPYSTMNSLGYEIFSLEVDMFYDL